MHSAMVEYFNIYQIEIILIFIIHNSNLEFSTMPIALNDASALRLSSWNLLSWLN